MPVGFKFRVRVGVVHLRRKPAQMTGHLAKPLTQAVDVVEALHVLVVALLVRARQTTALGCRQLLNAIEHARARLVLLANRALRNATVKHLIEVIRIRVHEDRLTRAAGRKIRHCRLSLHVLDRVHADAQMRQKRFGQRVAQRVINRRPTRGHAVAAAIATESAKERTMRRAGMGAMQPVNNLQSLLVRFQRLNRLGQFHLSQ